jgi:hypothetical protein
MHAGVLEVFYLHVESGKRNDKSQSHALEMASTSRRGLVVLAVG